MRPRVGRTRPEHALNVVVLPGAVRADEPGDAAERRREAQVVDRDEAAEPHGEVDDLEPAASPAVDGRRATAVSGTTADDRGRARRRPAPRSGRRAAEPVEEPPQPDRHRGRVPGLEADADDREPEEDLEVGVDVSRTVDVGRDQLERRRGDDAYHGAPPSTSTTSARMVSEVKDGNDVPLIDPTKPA